MKPSTEIEESLNNALIILGRKEVHIHDLKTENASLRAQVKILLECADAARSSESVLSPRIRGDQPSEPAILANYGKLARKYNDLAQRNRDLEAKLIRSHAYVEDATKKYYAAKDVTKKWKDWCERNGLLEKQRVAGDPLPSPVERQHSEESKSTPRALQIATTAPASAGRNAGSAVVSEDLDAVHPAKAPNRPCDEDSAHHVSCSPHIARVTSSQTTENESIPTSVNPLKRELSSDDEPLVISARSLKRSKKSIAGQAMSPPVRIKQEPNVHHLPVELDSEAYSSPVLQRKELSRKETSDLDALSKVITTPHKHIRQQVKQERDPSPTQSHPNISPLSLTRDDTAENADDEDAHVKDEPGMPTPLRLQRQDPPATTAEVTPRDAARNARVQALRPISGNVRAKAHPLDSISTSKRRHRDDSISSAVRMLAEDGEDGDIPAPRNEHETELSTETPKTVIRRRLANILDETTPNKLPLHKSEVLEPVKPRSSEHETRRPSRSPRDVKPSTRPAKQPPGEKTHRTFDLEASPPSVEPDDEPLRLRPFSTLVLDDFRVNSKYMNTDFAFADTLRGRDQRRCLPGCTSPECCGGAFRKFIAMGGGSAPLSSKSDAEVLEAYLGANWAEIIGAYAPAKRRNLLDQARAHVAAQQFGKHRDAFQRRSTPPGFWRTEMATTQEALEDRARANEMERRKVEERWREALREGGRWRFRDE